MAYCEQVDKVLGDAGLLADGFTVWDLLRWLTGRPADRRFPRDRLPRAGHHG